MVRDQIPMARPPLGERPDFEKMEREALAKWLSAEYIPVTRYPSLHGALQTAEIEVNQAREELGLARLDLPATNTRLIKNDVYNGLSGQTHIGPNGAFFDYQNRISYVRAKSEEFESDLSLKVNATYHAVHEFVHSGMKGSGIQEYSFNLSEGLTDRFARGIMQKIVPTMTQNDRREGYVRWHPSIRVDCEEIPITADGLILVETAKLPVGYAYISQIRLIEKIDEHRKGTASRLLKAAFAGDNVEARSIMTEACGPEIADMLSDSYMRTTALIKEIEKRGRIPG